MVLKAEGSEWRAQKWLNLTLEECVEKRTHDCKVISGRDYEPSPIVRYIIYSTWGEMGGIMWLRGCEISAIFQSAWAHLIDQACRGRGKLDLKLRKWPNGGITQPMLGHRY